MCPRSRLVREYWGGLEGEALPVPPDHLHVLQSFSALAILSPTPRHTLVRLGAARRRSRGARMEEPEPP